MKRECRCSPRMIETIRQRVVAAREFQRERFREFSNSTTFAATSPESRL